MAIVTLDISEFRDIYPMFADSSKFSDSMIQNGFDNAELKVSNTNCSIVPEKPRKVLLYMLTAHIIAIRMEAIDGDWQAGILSSATEGSVSIGMSTHNIPDRNAWYMRTPFGQEYWEMTSKWRSMQFVSYPARPSWEGTNGRWWYLR